jgi:hypothetical protein
MCPVQKRDAEQTARREVNANRDLSGLLSASALRQKSLLFNSYLAADLPDGSHDDSSGSDEFGSIRFEEWTLQSDCEDLVHTGQAGVNCQGKSVQVGSLSRIVGYQSG